MSKPKHHKRGMGYYVGYGYGYSSAELHAKKGALPYAQNVRDEIRSLEKKGDTRKIAKLRSYLHKSLYSSV